MPKCESICCPPAAARYEEWAAEEREPSIGSLSHFANLVEHYGLATFTDGNRNTLRFNKKAFVARLAQFFPSASTASTASTEHSEHCAL